MSPDSARLLPPRILVVDDERQIHASLRLRLGKSCELASCMDPREALEKIGQTRFDLCLVDLHMPRLDGFAFIDAAQRVDPGLGYVVISAFDTHENLHRAIPLQVYDFLSKPLPDRAGLEARVPDWIEQTRQRRRDQELARSAGVIAGERDTARLEKEVELVASETARDALRQVAGLLTTIDAHLVSATAQLAARLRTDPWATQLLRGLEEARKTADAATTVAAGFFDSAYGNRDSSPALVSDGIRHAVAIATHMSRAEESNKVVDVGRIELPQPVYDLSGIGFLLMLVPAVTAALTCAAPNSTVAVRGEEFLRLDTVPRDPLRRSLLWLNRKHALGSHPGVLVTITASAPPLAPAQVEAWLDGKYAPFDSVPACGLVAGIRKCHGLLGVAVAPQADRFTLALALPV